jgi:hypothetical protein
MGVLIEVGDRYESKRVSFISNYNSVNHFDISTCLAEKRR